MDKHKYATYFWGVFLFIFLAIILSLNVSIGYWKFQKLVLGLTVRQNQMVFVSQWTMVSVKLSGINPAFLCYFGRWLIFFFCNCLLYLHFYNFTTIEFVKLCTETICSKDIQHFKELKYNTEKVHKQIIQDKLSVLTESSVMTEGSEK